MITMSDSVHIIEIRLIMSDWKIVYLKFNLSRFAESLKANYSLFQIHICHLP